jgi:hypothetical protein
MLAVKKSRKPQARVLAGLGDQFWHEHRGRGGWPDDRRRHDDRKRLARLRRLVVRTDGRPADCVGLGPLLDFDAHAAPPCFSFPAPDPCPDSPSRGSELFLQRRNVLL